MKDQTIIVRIQDLFFVITMWEENGGLCACSETISPDSENFISCDAPGFRTVVAATTWAKRYFYRS